jgi:hypothetical protein
MASVLIGQGRAPQQTARVRVTTAQAYAALGRRAEAEGIARALEAESRRRYVYADGIAAVHAALGNRDAAFRWLDRGVDERSSGVLYVRVRRWWEPLRADPRFAALVRRAGLP